MLVRGSILQIGVVVRPVDIVPRLNKVGQRMERGPAEAGFLTRPQASGKWFIAVGTKPEEEREWKDRCLRGQKRAFKEN